MQVLFIVSCLLTILLLAASAYFGIASKLDRERGDGKRDRGDRRCSRTEYHYRSQNKCFAAVGCGCGAFVTLVAAVFIWNAPQL
jgi:hypothetical protein